MKLKLILLTILLMTSVNVIAQERTDKSENIQAVTCRMKYRQYRHYYRAKDYVKDFDDKYSPAGLGVASFFIPGLGQGIADKWGAAAGFFFSDIVLTTGFVLSFEYTFDRYNRLTDVDATYLTGIAIGDQLLLKTWSVVDAVRTAKIKNLYIRDMRKLHSGLDIDMAPYFTYAPSSATPYQPVAGLSLKMTF